MGVITDALLQLWKSPSPMSLSECQERRDLGGEVLRICAQFIPENQPVFKYRTSVLRCLIFTQKEDTLFR